MDQQKMMGREPEHKVTIDVRWWNGAKLGLWRSKIALEIAERQAAEIVDRCQHEPGCAGSRLESEPCLAGCPDREVRMSALVILSAARQLAPIDATKPAQAPYTAPTREYFAAVIAELAACQAELGVLRGDKTTDPPPMLEAKAPPQLKEAT